MRKPGKEKIKCRSQRGKSRKKINRECFKECKEGNKEKAQNKSKSQTSPIIPHFSTNSRHNLRNSQLNDPSVQQFRRAVNFQSHIILLCDTDCTSPTTFSIDNTKQPAPLEREIFWQHVFLPMRWRWPPASISGWTTFPVALSCHTGHQETQLSPLF